LIYYANPSTEQIRDAMQRGQLGCIVTPHQGNTYFPDDWDVIADNGCFSDKWTHDHWFRWLLDQPRSIRFAVAPDVFDPTGAPTHDATLDRWRDYGPLIRRHGFTPAFVCQVGATPDTVPADADVLFLGGTTEWKLSHHASAIVAQAAREGRWVHMGRVNSERRLTAARSMGCNSVDGTYLTFGPDINLPRLLGWLERAEAEPMLHFS
jgi:hypothetical protein